MREDFYIVKAGDPRWDFAFNKLPKFQQDVFLTSQYAEICSKFIFPSSDIYCAIQEKNENVLLYPFVQRNIRSLSNQIEAPDYLDIRGIYGRSGVAVSNDNEYLCKIFWLNFINYCEENSIISSFGRIHPEMIKPYSFQSTFNLTEIGNEVTIDTTNKIESILVDAHHSVRKNLRKAQDSGLQFSEGSGFQYIEQIFSIYNETILRNRATKFYYFPIEFFESLLQSKYTIAKLYVAKLDDEVVSFEIVLLNEIYSHSFLGGTTTKHLKTQANTFLKVNIMKELNKLQIKKFYLGGGTKIDDNIFKYKSGFSPKSIHGSFIDGSVLDFKKYAEVKDFFSRKNLNIESSRIQFYDIL